MKSTTTYVEGSSLPMRWSEGGGRGTYIAVHGDVPISSATTVQQAMRTHDILLITKNDHQPNTQNHDSKSLHKKKSLTKTKSKNQKAVHKDDNHATVTITMLVDERRQDRRAHQRDLENTGTAGNKTGTHLGMDGKQQSVPRNSSTHLQGVGQSNQFKCSTSDQVSRDWPSRTRSSPCSKCSRSTRQPGNRLHI